MKHQLPIKFKWVCLLLIAFLSSSTWASQVTLPFIESFDESSPTRDLWEIINANDDNKTWNLKNGYAECPYHSSNASDDYLITPSISLQKDKLYKVSFEVITSSYNENLMLKIGKGASAELQTGILADFPNIKSTSYTTKEIYFEVEEDEEYNLSFYCYSKPDQNYVRVKNVSINESVNLPEAVSEVRLIAGKDEELTADLSWKNPVLNIMGSPLKEEDLNSIKIYRNEEIEPVYTLNNPVTGKTEVWKDENVPASGIHTYKIISYNNDMEGGTVVLSAWIGEGVELPYNNPMQNKSQFSDLVVVNADKDEKTWYLNSGGDARYAGISSVNPNDWILTPMVKLQKGYPYNISFKYYESSDDNPQLIKLTAGNAIDIDGQEVVTEFESLKYSRYPGTDLSATYIPQETGNYSFGIHLNGSFGGANILVYDLNIAVDPNFEPDQKPVASFTTEKGYILKSDHSKYFPSDSSVKFIDLSTNYPNQWNWTFEGGKPDVSTDQYPVVNYEKEGRYDVSLTSVNETGESDPFIIEDYITIGYIPQQVWNMPKDDDGTSVHLFEGNTGYVTGKNGIYNEIAERFEKPAAPVEISEVNILFSVKEDKGGILNVSVREDNNGLPGNTLSTTSIDVADMNTDGYTSIKLLHPVGVDKAFYIVVSGFETTTDVALCSSKEQETGTAYAYLYGNSWMEFSQQLGSGLTLNIVPTLVYSKLQITSSGGYKKKNIDNVSETITIESNVSWKAYTSSYWIKLDTAEDVAGVGDGSITFSVLENEDFSRHGFIRIEGGGIKKSIRIDQAGTGATNFKAVWSEEKGCVELEWDYYTKKPISTLYEDVESHPAFEVNSSGEIGWTYIDVDNKETLVPNSQGASFPNAGVPMAFMVFDPSATAHTSGSSYNWSAYSGKRYFASFCSDPAPNNDWLITPEMNIKEGTKIVFWARSLTSRYGLEKLRILYSSTENKLEEFTNILSEGINGVIEVPVEWTRYECTIPMYAKYIAINCVSDDALMLLIDDIYIGTEPPKYSTIRTDFSQEFIDQMTFEIKGKPAFNETRQQFVDIPLPRSTPRTYDEIMSWCDMDDSKTGTIGFGGKEFSIGAYWTSKDLIDKYLLKEVTGIRAVNFYVYDLPETCILTIYQDNEVIYSTPVNDLKPQSINEVKFPLELINSSKDLLVALSFTYDKGIYGPATTDSRPVRIGKNLINTGENWQTVESLKTDFIGNWKIEIDVELTAMLFEIVTYNVYRNGECIRSFLTSNIYSDCDIAWPGEYCYSISHVYPGNLESTLSESACITIPDPVSVEEVSFIASVYPNPVTDILHVDVKSVIEYIKVIDTTGRIIHQYNPNRVSTYSMNTLTWEPGTYFISVTTVEDGIETYKVIKK